MAPPFQVLKHFKFKLFFSAEPNPSIEPMAHIGFRSYQRAFNSTPKSIKVGIEACPHSNTNLKSIRSFEMEPLDSLKPPTKKKFMCFKIHGFLISMVEPIVGDDGLVSQV